MIRKQCGSVKVFSISNRVREKIETVTHRARLSPNTELGHATKSNILKIRYGDGIWTTAEERTVNTAEVLPEWCFHRQVEVERRG